MDYCKLRTTDAAAMPVGGVEVTAANTNTNATIRQNCTIPTMYAKQETNSETATHHDISRSAATLHGVEPLNLFEQLVDLLC